MNKKQTVGKKGEQLVFLDIEKRGFTIIGCNIHSRFGEIDILATRGKKLHIIEVKARTSDAFGHPIEALNAQKIIKLKKAVQDLQLKRLIPSLSYQLDFAAVLLPYNEPPTIEWFWNIGLQDLARY